MEYTKLSKAVLLAAALSAGFGAQAAKNIESGKSGSGSSSTSNLERVKAICLTSSSKEELDINNVRAMVLNGGDMWWNLADPKYEVPKVTDPNLPRKHSIFAGSLWIGGKDASTGNTLVAAQTYRQRDQEMFWPGPLDANGDIEASECAAWNFHAKVNLSDIEAHRSKSFPVPDADIPESILTWPARGNVYVNHNGDMNKDLAPFVDVDGSGDYDPTQGDYPDITGDQAIWWVYNDVGDDAVKVPVSGKIGLEIQTMAFAYITNDLINNMTFYSQKLINKGSKTLTDTYIGQWVDPDLGYFNDDYVGCDVARGLGICYNGDDLDEGVTGYGANPPALGVDFFKGPLADSADGRDNNRNGLIDEEGEQIIMSSFVYYNNDFSVRGNPETTEHYYNYLRSLWKDGNPITFGGYGKNDHSNDTYMFMFPGDSDPQGWGYVPEGSKRPPFAWTEDNTDGAGAKNQPADRRFLQAAGPFTMRPGAVNEVTIGVIWARANSGGKNGSLGLLLNADDKAQQLFDNNFELPAGPDAPKVEVTEFDQELILSIVPKYTAPNGQQMNTEGFVVEDPTLVNLQANDPFYYFEGYQIYQLRDANVTATDLDNPDKARLLAQGDLQNDVTTLINNEFSADVNQTVPKLKVSGQNQGVFHTLRITTDLFATNAKELVNFKKYHYMIVPYAQNSDSLNKEPYREGRRPVTVSGIPHKTQVESNGLVLNATYGSGLPVTRIFGTGNGGNVLEISKAEERAIVSNNSKLELQYEPGNAPVTIKVYDPKKVQANRFRLNLYSRVGYLKSSLSGGSIQPGDIIESENAYTSARTATAKFPHKLSNFPQIPGRARVLRIIDEVQVPGTNDVMVNLEVEMLNDHLGGTFVAEIDEIETFPAPSTAPDNFLGYNIEPREFTVVGSGATATAIEYTQNDYWILSNFDASGKLQGEIHSDKRISEFNEQLIDGFGIAVQMNGVRNPGYRSQTNRLNGFQLASLTFDGNQRWLTGVSNTQIKWTEQPPATQEDPDNLADIDPNYNYTNILGGTWAPYGVATKVTGGGPQHHITAPNAKALYKLRNVNIVFTPDTTLWTRAVVLQETANPAAGASQPWFRLTKKPNMKPSVHRNGSVDANAVSAFDGTQSKAMGWFPGYAVDIDRGVRLNIMFSESVASQGDVTGADLIFEPNSQPDAGKNWVYVMQTVYDEGRSLDYQFDRAATLPTGLHNAYIPTVFDSVMYVGYPKLAAGSDLLANEATVKIRVNRQYTSYPGGEGTNPEYVFSTDGFAPSTEQITVAQNAMDLIRVVPNPYYAFSEYEQRQLDNIVKITNLPRRCDIAIYTLNGTLVRTFRKDSPETWVDWNLKNESNLPIASGSYIIHVDAGNIGETVVKWFGVIRPIDLESF